MQSRIAGKTREHGPRRDRPAAGARGYSEPAPAQWQRDLAGDVAQRTAMPGEPATPSAARAPARSDATGLPARLKAGIEALSGMSLDGVRVHHDSPKPARLHALAYTQGRDIHVAPGQAQHLPHEAWHVVQQAQGRVAATRQMKQGVPLNDDRGLEREADIMGQRALSTPLAEGTVLRTPQALTAVAQRYATHDDIPGLRVSQHEEFATTADNKVLVATKLAVSRANVELRRAGALTLLQLGELYTADAYLVTPTINPRVLKSRIWQRMQDNQPQDGFRSFADCFRTAATVGGVDPGARNEPPMILNLPTGPLPVMSVATGRGYGAPNLAARAAASFFLHALPAFDVTLGALAVTAERTAIRTQIALFGRLAGAPKIIAGHNAYKLILAHADSRDRFVPQFGVNGAAAPVVGTMLTQFNDPAEKEALGGDRWNFHWAGVVMVDGSDYVTLENCAVELEEATAIEMLENVDIYTDNIANPQLRGVRNQRDTKQDMLNNRWYFKLYGADAQSFHTEMLADPHATPSALTLPLRKQ